MNINYINGDLLNDKSEALVNTVNCVGVMGKGIALSFKKRWAENYSAYKSVCEKKELRPGKLFIWQNTTLISDDEPKFIINFPTKDHWRNDSKIEFIQSGLDSLVIAIKDLKIKSIAIPPLGCGNGGLNWHEVKPLIIKKISTLDGVEFNIYNPPHIQHDDPPEQDPISFRMTHERALLIKAISAAEPNFFGEIDRLSLHKIAYLLNAIGVNLNIDFTQNSWGPYSEKFKNVIKKLEELNVLSRRNDGNEFIHVTPSGFAHADEYIQKNNISEDKINRLISLISGFENPYGLELLTNIHILAEFAEVAEIKGLLSSKAKRSHIYSDKEIMSGIKRMQEFSLI